MMAEGEIDEVSVSHLIQAVEETGRYSFLIGAGTSRPAPAGIPTAGELIDRWQEECYDRDDPQADFEAWVEEMEEPIDESEQYGFWFEERHPARGQRRERIRDLVEDAEPTPYHIVLATMMSEPTEYGQDINSKYVPHTLTPNFDDLLFDAFYRYLEDRPQLINHSSVASEFRVTRDRPTIVKLHGDYLYDNLQNTDDETSTLKEELQEILEQVVREYGLVVVGYGGNDESIMDPLLDADIEYGIYWCTRDRNKLSPKAKQLLKRSNTFLVPIKGFESLMAQFGNQINDIKLPDQSDLVERAKRRADQLDGTLEIREQEATDDEEEEFVEKSNLRSKASIANRSGEYQKAINFANQLLKFEPNDASGYFSRGRANYGLDQYQKSINNYDRVIELDSESVPAYYNRGLSKSALGEHEAAIKDFDRAANLDPQDSSIYVIRGKSKATLNEHEAAIKDFDRAIDLDPEFATAYFNRARSRSALDEHETAIEDYDQAIKLDPKFDLAYKNRAEEKILIDEFESAHRDANTAISLVDLPGTLAESLLLYLISGIAIDEDMNKKEEKYMELCEGDFTTNWNFDSLDQWVATVDMKNDKKDRIQNLIEQLREHKAQ